MQVWSDVLDPVTLTGYGRRELEDYDTTASVLSQFLPTETKNGAVVKLDDPLFRVNASAQYRAFDAETPINGGIVSNRAIVELPPLGVKVRFGEYDQLRAAGQESGTSAENALLTIAGGVARAIAERMELARGAVLATGKLSINENGFVSELDFGRSAEMNATAANLWNTAGADPIADLQAWIDAYAEKNGFNPGTILLSTAAMAALQKNDKVKALLGPSAPSQVSRSAVQAILADYGVPVSIVYDKRVKGDKGYQRVIPADTLLMLPAATEPLGATVYGVTLESTLPEYGIPLADQPGIVVGAYRDNDPVAVWVRGNAIGTPVLSNPDFAMAAKVL